MSVLSAARSFLPKLASPAEVSSLLGTMAQVSAGLFAVALTLVALVPTLVEIARVKSGSYLSGHTARRRLQAALRRVTITIWIFGICTLICLIGPALGGVFLGIYVLLAVSTLLAIGIAILIYAGHVIAQITRSVI